jgi:hypothetical protein
MLPGLGYDRQTDRYRQAHFWSPISLSLGRGRKDTAPTRAFIPTRYTIVMEIHLV